jgi:hypothetical protein
MRRSVKPSESAWSQLEPHLEGSAYGAPTRVPPTRINANIAPAG